MGAISNEWKGAIKSNSILETTGCVWSKPDDDFTLQDFKGFLMQIQSPLVVPVMPRSATLDLANYRIALIGQPCIRERKPLPLLYSPLLPLCKGFI